MKIPTIDIILPIYKPDEMVFESINSILNQTYTDWHLYVIDDASGNNYLDKIKVRYAENNDKISYYQFKRNKRAAACRNFAINKGKGKYITFIDQDDVWSNKKLELQITYFKNNSVDAVHGNIKIIDKDGNVFFHDKWQKENSSRRNIEWSKMESAVLARMIFIKPNIRIISSMITRNIFKKIGGFKDKFFGGEDELFWFEIAVRGKIGYIDDYLFFRREHDNNAVNKFKTIRKIGYYNALHFIKKKYHNIIKDSFDIKEQMVLRSLIVSLYNNKQISLAIKYYFILLLKYPANTIKISIYKTFHG